MVTRVTRRDFGKIAGTVAVGAAAMVFTRANAQDASPDERARLTEQRMTDDERFSLIISLIGAVPSIGILRDKRIPEDVKNMSAGYTAGVPRLGVPALQSSDGSMGVTNPGYRPDDKGATAFPASILVGASFNPQLAREGGAAIGREARVRGLNTMLAGGINLVRDARNGRNYEYYSEDPWVSAVFGAEAVNGIQGEGIISTLKHYTLNCNETNRHWLDAIIDPDSLRETDLLAFQIAIERSQPGAIMSGYNKINGVYASGNNHLLNEVLKGAWGYKGWVMSDWGAVPEWEYALKGLDQESGIQLDVKQWGAEAFTDRLRMAYAEGKLPKERLSDMVRRILRSMYAVGVDKWGPPPSVDMAKHNAIALEIARQGIVLLKNEDALPLPANRALKIAVIGGYAQLGVPSGTGSGAVLPVGGFAGVVPIGGAGTMGVRTQSVHHSLVAARRIEEAFAASADRLRWRVHSGGIRAAREAVGCGHRLRHPGRGRRIRRARSVAAVGAGRRDRRRGERESQHHRGAGNRQSGFDAVARQGESDRAGVVCGPVGRTGDRRNPRRQDKPVRPAADHLPCRPEADAAAGACGPRHAVGHGYDHPL